MIVGSEDIPTGDEPDPVGRRSRRTARTPTCATGTLSLYHGDTKVGEGRDQDPARSVRRSPAPALYVGRHAGEPITDDYPGEAPYAFTGGTIKRVAVDVSGEPYIDIEREAEMLLRSQ